MVIMMGSLSTPNQSDREIALLAIEGRVIWALGTIEPSIMIVGDIKSANPDFDMHMHTSMHVHVDVYDQEIKG